MSGVEWLLNTRKRKWPKKDILQTYTERKYNDYEDSLLKLNLETLKERRNFLTLKFAKSGIKYDKLNDLLPEHEKRDNVETRNQEKYKVNFANTGRLKNSSIITMQNLLNDDAAKERERKRNCG